MKNPLLIISNYINSQMDDSGVPLIQILLGHLHLATENTVLCLWPRDALFIVPAPGHVAMPPAALAYGSPLPGNLAATRYHQGDPNRSSPVSQINNQRPKQNFAACILVFTYNLS